ncbi:MAG: SPFH domain-containing protein [Eubacteriales bacterium]|nr:SPFH domain-containing protein [Eubacteriales bacterium]
MNIILTVASLILFAFCVFVSAVNYIRKQNHNDDLFITKTLHRSLIVVAAVFLVGSLSFSIIPTGSTGVKSTFGQIDAHTLHSGFNWKIPIAQNIAVVNNKQQDVKFDKDKIWSETSKRTAIYYKDITVTYQINPEKSAWIYANVTDYENNMISQAIVSSGIKSASKTLSDTDATNRAKIEPLVLRHIQNAVDEKYGAGVLHINKVVIANADFDESYSKAVAEKQKAQLAAEKQAIENEKNIKAAEAKAKIKKTNAQADADALKIKSEAQAEANKKVSSSLNDDVLTKQYIEKWDGKLPNTVAGDSSTVLIPNSEKSK